MVYLIEVVQRNRLVKVLRRTPHYDTALNAFQDAKAMKVREARFFKQDERGKVLLKYLDKTATRAPTNRFA